MKKLYFLLLLVFSGNVHASLIGDTVNFECDVCGVTRPGTFDTFTVVEGEAELNWYSVTEIDVESASLRITHLVYGGETVPANFVLSGIDEYVTSVTVNPTSTWGVDPLVSIAFGSHYISIAYNGNNAVGPGDFLLLDIETTPVPLPAAFWLFLSGLIGLYGVRKPGKG